MVRGWATRCVRTLLPVLFVTAQIAGVLPLLHDHTVNLYETTPVASHLHVPATVTVAQPAADHHHGALDQHDQCCALHALSGPLPHVRIAAPVILLSVAITATDQLALSGIQPHALERPPRPS